MEYKVFFVDGDVHFIKGTMKHFDNTFWFYGEDGIIKYIIPESQIKYIEVRGEN